MRKIGISIFLLAVIFFTSIIFSNGQEDAQLREIVASLQIPDSIPPVEFLPGTQQAKVVSARHQFTQLSGVPDFYAEAIYLAIWHFPELKDVDIRLVFKHIGTTMQVQPAFGSVFKKAEKRTYYMVINNKNNFEGILFGEIPFNAQVGIVSHELCHILDYQRKSTFGLIGTGLRFLSKKGRRRYERYIDQLTVYKWMGWQLRDWAQYAIFDSDATDEYKAFKKHNYLNPQEVEALIEKIDKY